MKKVYRDDKTCLNCGSAVEQKYCPSCGQANIELHVPAWEFMVHLVGDFFHFDSKFFKTILPLLFRPGKLTTAFLNGKRKAYFDPLRLYIFVSIIYFGMLTLFPPNQVIRIDEKEATIPDWTNRSQTSNIHVTYDDLKADSTDGMVTGKLKEILRTNLARAHNDQEKLFTELTYKSYSNLPKAMFLLLPFFALILKLFFRQRHYVDHAVFALHIHTATFIFLTIARVPGMFEVIVLIYMLIYLSLSLKRVYNRSWAYTAVAFGGISVIYALAFTCTFLSIIFLNMMLS